MSPFDTARAISYSPLMETMRMRCTVFETTRYLSKVAHFSYPLVFGAPLKVTQWKFHQDVWHKTYRERYFHGATCCRFGI